MTITELKQLLEKKGQVFLTGAGGTGKTYTLQHLLPRYSNPIILATTNSASVRIGGDTVHSAFRLGTANSLQELEAEDDSYYKWFMSKVRNDINIAKSSRIKPVRELLRNADIIVIDEISMLSASTFALLFHRARQAQLPLPPLLMLGDLFQIPPVETKDAITPQRMIYHCDRFKPVIIELTQIKRTQNIDFALAQKSIRKGKYTEFAHNELLKIANNSFDATFDPTILVATNIQADKINRDRLAQLNTDEIIIPAEIETQIKNEKQIAQIIRYMPPDRTLTIKKGAKVMFIANDKEQGYYNGLQGTIQEIHFDDFHNPYKITIQTDTKEISLGKATFDKKKLKIDINGNSIYETELTMKQFPIKVCYAMTIHKSQGSSIKNLEIDCNRIFTSGQFYVAISRAIDPKTIRLRNFNPQYVRIKNLDLEAYIQSQKESIIQVPEIVDDSLKIQI